MADYKTVTIGHCRQDGQPYMDDAGDPSSDGVSMDDPMIIDVSTGGWPNDLDGRTYRVAASDISDDAITQLEEHLNSTIDQDDCVTFSFSDPESCGDVTISYKEVEETGHESDEARADDVRYIHVAYVEKSELCDSLKNGGTFTNAPSSDVRATYTLSEDENNSEHLLITETHTESSGVGVYNSNIPQINLQRLTHTDEISMSITPADESGGFNQTNWMYKSFWRGNNVIKQVNDDNFHEEVELISSPGIGSGDDRQDVGVAIVTNGYGQLDSTRLDSEGNAGGAFEVLYNVRIEKYPFTVDEIFTPVANISWTVRQKQLSLTSSGGIVSGPNLIGDFNILPSGGLGLDAETITSGDCECDDRAYTLKYQTMDCKGCSESLYRISDETANQRWMETTPLFHEENLDFTYVSIPKDEMPQILQNPDGTGAYKDPAFGQNREILGPTSPFFRYSHTECKRYEFTWINFDDMASQPVEFSADMFTELTEDMDAWPEKTNDPDSHQGTFCCTTRLRCSTLLDEPSQECLQFWRNTDSAGDSDGTYQDSCNLEDGCNVPSITETEDCVECTDAQMIQEQPNCCDTCYDKCTGETISGQRKGNGNKDCIDSPDNDCDCPAGSVGFASGGCDPHINTFFNETYEM